MQRDCHVGVRPDAWERADRRLAGYPVVDQANGTVYVPDNVDGEVSYFGAGF